MIIPGYVQDYWRAQWWQFLYFGLPIFCIAAIVALISAWQSHEEDMHVNDEPDPNALPPGKTLGL